MQEIYDRETDTLTILLESMAGTGQAYQAEDLLVEVNDEERLTRITIDNARDFLARLLAAGVLAVDEDAEETEPEPGMLWHNADSSVISAYGYDEASQTLEVAFNQGVYRYHHVPPPIFEGLQQAPSKGKYLRQAIIDMYPTERKRGRMRRAPRKNPAPHQPPQP